MKRPTEAGYSLLEVLVVASVVALIAAGTFAVYDASNRIYQRATALEDAQLRARAGLALMVTDLRLIGAYWTGATGAGSAIVSATPTSISFMADVNGESVHDNIDAATAAPAQAGASAVTIDAPPSRVVRIFNTYANPALNDFVYVAHGSRREVGQVTSLSGSTLTLARPLASTYPAGSLVRSVEKVTYALNPATGKLTRAVGGSGALTVVNDVAALAMTYFDGRHPGSLTSDPSRIREIHIALTTAADDHGTRAMTSRVRLRN